jgi:hypothetical protein
LSQAGRGTLGWTERDAECSEWASDNEGATVNGEVLGFLRKPDLRGLVPVVTKCLVTV